MSENKNENEIINGSIIGAESSENDSPAEAAIVENYIIDGEKASGEMYEALYEADKKKSKKGEKLKAAFTTKSFRFGMHSSALTALVIVLVIAVNILAGHLPGTLNSIDISANEVYSIGSQTKELLDSLEEDITISVLSAKDSSDENINALLDKYEGNSKHITVKYIDTSTDVGASQTYSDYNANSLIVSNGEKETVIDYADIYQQDYSSYYTTGSVSTSFDGEGQITSAIYKMTADNAQMLYCLTGHGETELGTSVSNMISKQNMETSDLNLLASDVPEDCSAIIINGPTEDISADEAEKLKEYISSGGNVMLLLAFSMESQPNLDSVLNAYGVQRAGGIAMETSGNMYNYAINIIAGIESTDITSELADEKANIIMTNVIAIKASETEGITSTTLLSSSDGAYAKQPQEGQLATLEKEAGDTDGPFAYAVLCEEDENGGKLAVVASETLLEDAITQSLPVSNLEFFISCMADMCGGGNPVSIDAKSMDIEYLTIPALHSMIWLVVCVVLIPLVIFVTGLVIWLIRRKR